MRNTTLITLLLALAVLPACRKDMPAGPEPPAGPIRFERSIGTDSVTVQAVIEQPANDTADVMLVFHGTVQFDSLILDAAYSALDGFKGLLDNDSMLLISVAYPEENLLFGDNLRHCEAALLWVREKTAAELGMTLGKVFLAGHSQGGYLVTRLNTLHPSDGVIANAPGPLNLVYRCQLEESGQIPSGITCTRLRQAFGTTQQNPDAYMERSLLPYTNGYRSDILFVQGLADSPIQMYSWPGFRQKVEACSDCQELRFLELPGLGHPSLFNSALARQEFQAFLKRG